MKHKRKEQVKSSKEIKEKLKERKKHLFNE